VPKNLPLTSASNLITVVITVFDNIQGWGRKTKGDEDFEDVPNKPSARATLFDFLTEKIPSGESKGRAVTK